MLHHNGRGMLEYLHYYAAMAHDRRSQVLLPHKRLRHARVHTSTAAACRRPQERGIKHFKEVEEEQRGKCSKVIPGETAFFLYDSMGFPLDLTQVMAQEVRIRLLVVAQKPHVWVLRQPWQAPSVSTCACILTSVTGF